MVEVRLLPSYFCLLTSVTAPQPPQPPIIVKLVEPEGDPTGLAAVLIGALGLTGVIVVIAVLLGLVTGAVLFWIRSRSA
jgi:hypothetical protein